VGATTHQVTSPDGLEWAVSTHRIKWPGWRHSQYEPGNDAGDDVFGAVIAYLIVAPVMWFVVPFFVVLGEVPVALVRAVFSSDRWIEARASYPSSVRIQWRASKADAADLASEIANRLSRGYESLTPDGARLVEMTEPPGLKDLDR
jgi:hypothetical protein